MIPQVSEIGCEILEGDALTWLQSLGANAVQCCVTSPPYYGLRDYGHAEQIGLEPTPDEYVASLVAVFAEVRRVLRDDGTLWLNIGDSYNAQPGQRKSTDSAGPKQASDAGSVGAPSRSWLGAKPKDLLGIPWMLAFALRADGWYLRQEIIWSKPNPMPESVTDRPTRAHEQLFLLSKSPRYYYDYANIAEPAIYAGDNRRARTDKTVAARIGYRPSGKPRSEPTADLRNKRSVWEIATQPYSEAHFATFPKTLVEPCVLAGSAAGDLVLDPFAGSGTVGQVAISLGRSFVGIELNPDYCELARRRCQVTAPLFA